MKLQLFSNLSPRFNKYTIKKWNYFISFTFFVNLDFSRAHLFFLTTPAPLALSILLIATGCYSGEVSFILPLAWGCCGLLLRNKIAPKDEKIFYWGLIVSAILFLILYYFISYIHIEKSYDSSHGTGVSIIENAVYILLAQKFLWLALIVFCVRVYDVLVRKKLKLSMGRYK